jgi:Protein of unknown function (DUF1822)
MSRFLESPPTQVELAITPEAHAQAWQQAQTSATEALPTAERHWQTYRTAITQLAVLPWLQAELDPSAQLAPTEAIALGINGTAIELTPNTPTAKRLILIPEEAAESNSLQPNSLQSNSVRIPQEWITDPDWMGDYYIAVSVNADALRLRGYITHAQLVQQAVYNPGDRTYELSDLELVADMDALWVVRQLNPQEATRADVAQIVAAMPNSVLEQSNALEQPPVTTLATSNPSLDSPMETDTRSILPPQAPLESAPVANLSQWLNQLFDQTWESLDAFLSPQSDMAFSFRKLESMEVGKICRVKAVHVRSHGVSIEPGSAASTQSQSLGGAHQLSTQHLNQVSAAFETPSNAPRELSAQPLEFSLDQRVLLVLRACLEPDGRVGVQVNLLPAENSQPLPVGLNLRMWSASGSLVQSAQVQDPNGYVQLKLFRSVPGTRFALQLAIEDFNAVEHFIC